MDTLVKLSDNLFQEECIILSGHSLLLGNQPTKLTAEQVISKLEKNGGVDLGKFGLFDSSSPNYTTFYPGITAEDLTPQEGDFIHPVFRMLSMTIVNADSYPIDFTKAGVLRNSMPLIYGITVNPDHEPALGNALGAVESVFWQNAYTDPVSGSRVPAGIMGKFKIDGKSNPRIARGILMSPPSIHSNSVTVRFQWEKSHPTLSDGEFYDRWGTKMEDGSLVRKVATLINLYKETSLVGLGADPYAQITDSAGKILDPTRGKRMYINSQSNSADKAVYGVYESDYKNPITFAETAEEVSFTRIKETNSSFNNPLSSNTMELDFTTLNASLKLTGDKEIKDQEGLLAYIQNLNQQVDSLNTTISNLGEKMPAENILTALKGEGVTDYLLSADFMKDKEVRDAYTAHLQDRRKKVVANLKLAKGEDVSPELVKVIETGSLAAIEALDITYLAEIENKMPLTCEECHSTKVSRASSVKHDPDHKSTGDLSAREAGEKIKESHRMKGLKEFAGVKA